MMDGDRDRVLGHHGGATSRDFHSARGGPVLIGPQYALHPTYRRRVLLHDRVPKFTGVGEMSDDWEI